MNSIRSYLALRLLVGFVGLMSIASILIFFISKRILESDFDARLFAKAQAVVASASQKGTKIDIDWTNLPQELNAKGKKSGLIQVLDSSGQNLGGNAFLGVEPFPLQDHASYSNENSTQGEKLRVLTLPFLPAVEEDDDSITPASVRQKCLLIVGSDRDQLDHSLNLMAGVLVAMTVITSVFSLGIVAFVLRRGLHPLAALGLEVAGIDESSLGKRIDLDSAPEEVLPIVEKLNDLLSRLEISFARERRFSADVSHELRTPITELRSLAEIMLRQPHLPIEIRQSFQDVLGASCQMESLVGSLLQIVRNERGVSSLEIAKVNLSEVLQTAWEAYDDKAQTKQLKQTFDLPGELWVETDLLLLRLVINNLLSNAFDYTPVGGSVEIKIQQLEKQSVLCIQNSTHDVIWEDLSHFFDRFWRKDKVRGNSEHTGLGLSLSRVICQRLGIHMTVSMPNPSTVAFWLSLNQPSIGHLESLKQDRSDQKVATPKEVES